MKMNRKEWLDERRKFIGGSDSPVILLGSRHPFKTPRELWMEKRGLAGDTPITPPMERGTALEGLIAQKYQEATGRKTRRSRSFLRHPQNPWMVGNIDRLIVGVAGKGPGVLEIKCPGLKVFSRIKREGIPDYYQIQLQHYLAVSGRKWGAFAVFNAELWELIHFDVERDDELIALIIFEGEKFFHKVRSGEEPQEEEEETALHLPDVGGAEGYVKLADDAWERAVVQFRQAKELYDESDLLLKDAKERLKNILIAQGATVGEGCGLRAYRRTVKGRETFDWKGFRQLRPDLEGEMGPFIKTGAGYETLSTYFLKEENEYE